MIALLIAVLWVYRGYKRSGQMLILTYLGALVATQMSVTLVFKLDAGFNSPCFLTACQLLLQVFVSHVWVMVKSAYDADGDLQKKSGGRGLLSLVAEVGLFEWIRSFGLLAIIMTGALLAQNAAIMFIGLGLSSILSALTPLLTAFFSSAFGSPFPSRAWMGLAIVSIGAVVALSGLDLKNADGRKKSGVFLALLALVCRALKTTLQDLFMTRSLSSLWQSVPGKSAVSEQATADGTVRRAVSEQAQEVQRTFSPEEVFALQSPLMFAICVIASAALEGYSPWLAVFRSPVSRIQVLLWIGITISSVVSCVFGWTALSVVKLLGAAAAQIVGKLNIVITAILAITLLHEHVGNEELLGGAFLVLGAYVFEKEVSGAKKPPSVTKGAMPPTYSSCPSPETKPAPKDPATVPDVGGG